MSIAVYELKADPNMRWLEPTDPSEDLLIHVLQGESLIATWKPLRIQEVLDDELPTGPVSDFPYMGGAPTFSAKAAHQLSDLLHPNGELLPLRAEFGEFYVYNVTTVIDALDTDQSLIERFNSSGRVKRIRRFVFRPDAVESAVIFKIPELVAEVFVTLPFKGRVQEAGLTGFKFDRLWPS